MRRFTPIARAAALALALAGPAVAQTAAAQDAAPPKGFERIQHIIVVYLENHSFDNLFGTFPGANGLARRGRAARQVDRAGKPYVTLPPPTDTHRKPPAPTRASPPIWRTGHSSSTAMCRRPPWSRRPRAPLLPGDRADRRRQDGQVRRRLDARRLAMGYYDGSKMRLWDYAKQFTLADNFFHAALRRLVPQPFLDDLRLHAALRERAG